MAGTTREPAATTLGRMLAALEGEVMHQSHTVHHPDAAMWTAWLHTRAVLLQETELLIEAHGHWRWLDSELAKLARPWTRSVLTLIGRQP
jgi:hypothetical protein